MKTLATPLQFYTDQGIGTRLANAMAHKALRRAASLNGAAIAWSDPNLSGNMLDDMLSLASDALLEHVWALLHANPIKVLKAGPDQTRIRVCGALDYVIDKRLQRVWTEPSPLSATERKSKRYPPRQHPFPGQSDLVDLLNPLSRAAWLVHIAARPGWFGTSQSAATTGQPGLFVSEHETSQAASMVAARVWLLVCHEKAMVVLRHQLSATLVAHIGPSLVDLAMKSRLDTRRVSLNGRHLNKVWQNRAAYETMHRENPKLLTALTAWLAHKSGASTAPLPDAIPAMRKDLLGNGLQPKAWRNLAQYGLERLLPLQLLATHWPSLVKSLRALQAARWPALPPRSFLRLMHQAAGLPDTYEISDHGVPGWFWQMACTEGAAVKGDTAAYLDLFDRIPHWAWLVREFGLIPDANQRRNLPAWLDTYEDAHKLLLSQASEPEWVAWLRNADWGATAPLQVVPIHNLSALVKEAITMHNCADSYKARCSAETHIMLSLRDHQTGRRVALACIEKRGGTWALGQVAGPCNKAVSALVRESVQKAVAVVRYHHQQQLSQRPLASGAESGDLQPIFVNP